MLLPFSKCVPQNDTWLQQAAEKQDQMQNLAVGVEKIAGHGKAFSLVG